MEVASGVAGPTPALTAVEHKIRTRETRLLVRAVVQRTALLVQVAEIRHHLPQLAVEASLEEMQQEVASLIPQEVGVGQAV